MTCAETYTGAGRGAIVVVSGHSGSGKTSLCRGAIDRLGLAFSVSATTREMRREGEDDGSDYHFLSRDEFDERKARGWFAETAEVFGEQYGTPRGPLEDAIGSGRIILVDCDIQGARSLRERYSPFVRSVFIRAPSDDALRERLSARGTESAEKVRRRLARVAVEMKASGEFERVIVNDDLERATAEFLDFLEDLQRSIDGRDH